MATHLQCPPNANAMHGVHATSSLRSRSSGSSTSSSLSLSSAFSDLASSESSVHSEQPNSHLNSNSSSTTNASSSANADSNASYSKTNAFFASPFSSHPPSPTPTPPPPPPYTAPPPPSKAKPRSLTEEFFSTPARPPSPPASSSSISMSVSTSSKPGTIHPSRIFPSRYTSQLRRSPEAQFVDLDEVTAAAAAEGSGSGSGHGRADHQSHSQYHHHHHLEHGHRYGLDHGYGHGHGQGHGHDRDASSSAWSAYSAYSDSSPLSFSPSIGSTSATTSSSSFVVDPHPPRLPTPPPSASISRRALHRDDTIVPASLPSVDVEKEKDAGLGSIVPEEATPRPADLEPNMLHFERSLLLSRQSEPSSSQPRSPSPEMMATKEREAEIEEEQDLEEPHEGTIIELPALDFPWSYSSSYHYPYSNSANSTAASTPASTSAVLPLSPLSLNFSLASSTSSNASREGERQTSSHHHQHRAGGHIDRGTPTPTNESSISSGSTSAFDPDFPNGYTAGSSTFSTSTHQSQPVFTTSPESTHPPSFLPLPSSNNNHAPPPPLPPPIPLDPPKIRLVKSLGHGAFSAVWLAEDLSRVPLTLVAKRSVRDLRRRVSGRGGRERERDKKDRDRNGNGERKDTELEGAKETREVEEVLSTPVLNGKEDTPRAVNGNGTASAKLGADETTPTPATPLQTRRQPSRLREGLRNMLSFSRTSATAASPSTPVTPSAAGVNTSGMAAMPSPISPSLGSGHHADRDREFSFASPSFKHSSNNYEWGVNEDGSLSRHSSIKSLPSVASEHSSVSRNSSTRSSRGPSRNSSLRLALHRPHPHQEEHGAIPEMEESTSKAHASSSANANANATLSRDSSLKKFRARVRGTKPASALRLGYGSGVYLDERDGEMGEPVVIGGTPEYGSGSRPGSSSGLVDGFTQGRLSRNSSLGSSRGGSGSARNSNSLGAGTTGRLVAVKMTPRKPRLLRPADARERKKAREEEERTRVGFVREVEVLRHISHPNITPLLAHLSTATHHILVLPYLPGGDLLGLVNSDVAWGKLGESVLRRIWCELCKAVGWMHGVGLVHRDIKLENILLTTPVFTSLLPHSPRPTLASLPAPPSPLIKLTDFGLSRFVELHPSTGDAELLTTRCGSEAYAAPELVTGASGGYDARRTDAWACGVVLYALVGRRLPFGEGVGGDGGGQGAGRIGGERERAYYSMAERRHWLMRIARGEWEWPSEPPPSASASASASGSGSPTASTTSTDPEDHELVGPQLVRSQGAKRIVSRLLVRDPRKRARIVDLWDDVWMQNGFGGLEGLESAEGIGGARDVVMADVSQEEEAAADVEASPSSTARSLEDGDEDADSDMTGAEEDVRFYDQPTAMGTEYFEEREGGGAEYPRRPTSSEGEEDWEDVEEDGEEDGEADEEYEDAEEGLNLEEEEEEEEEEEGGCLFDHEGIDSITRREVV